MLADRVRIGSDIGKKDVYLYSSGNNIANFKKDSSSEGNSTVSFEEDHIYMNAGSGFHAGRGIAVISSDVIEVTSNVLYIHFSKLMLWTEEWNYRDDERVFLTINDKNITVAARYDYEGVDYEDYTAVIDLSSNGINVGDNVIVKIGIDNREAWGEVTTHLMRISEIWLGEAEDELFLYNYGGIYGNVGERASRGKISYNSDHIEIMADDMAGAGGFATLVFDTPLTNLYSKVTIESELINSFGDGDIGWETYFLNDIPNPHLSAPSNYLHQETSEHSKNSITLDIPSDANGEFLHVDLFVSMGNGYEETRYILKVYSVRLHN